ncbi:hypothetical protein [Nostoc sp. C117]|uniref:hypothetical protein n=1 Tax=Nostoc sp. C117 TaxID=3349875 RepID=UPI00370DAF4C
MTLEKERRSIGVFAEFSDAELALQELKAANFPMQKVSIIARNAQKQSDIASIEVKENTGNASEESTGAITSGALASLTSLLVGTVVLTLHGIGPVMLVGAEARAIATTLAGGAIGSTTCGLPSALLALGIPKEQAQDYSDLVFQGYYLVIVTGVEVEIRFAKRVFNRHSIQQWSVYQPYLSPKNRYKYGVGVFSRLHDVEATITELRKAGFPMSQVSLITKDNYNVLGIPDTLVKYYEEQLNLGYFLILLNTTDIYMAGARAILESNNIQHFRIYSQLVVNAAKNDVYAS